MTSRLGSVSRGCMGTGMGWDGMCLPVKEGWGTEMNDGDELEPGAVVRGLFFFTSSQSRMNKLGHDTRVQTDSIAYTGGKVAWMRALGMGDGDG